MPWNLTADQSAAFSALGTVVTAALTVGIFLTSRTLAKIEKARTTADFRLAWSEIHPLAYYVQGPRDFMILVTNAGGHASSIEKARLIVRGETQTALKVSLRQPDNADFPSLNIQPGEQVKMRAVFVVPEGQTLEGKGVVLEIKPVLGPLVTLRHDFNDFHAADA